MNGWRKHRMPRESRLYEIGIEFDEPVPDDVLDELEITERELGTLSPTDLLRQFTI